MKILYVILGFIFLGIGAIGVVLPILPTTPFLLAASFFFARGSDRFNRWFLSTNLYKNHLESFLKSRAMTFKTKARILTLSTTMLIIAIYMVDNIYARIGIGVIMLYKYYYFKFKIKTIQVGKSSVAAKRIREKAVVTKMINIYCRGNRHGKNTPCIECRELTKYAYERIDACPLIKSKTFCSNCKVHCYKLEMRDKIRAVMRYSGPRMIFYHPIMAIKHVIDGRREIKKLQDT